MKYKTIILLCVFSAFFVGCGGDGIPADPEPRDYSALYAPLPNEPIYPADNPYNIAKEQLGELLFWDPILSGNQNVACASCHHPDHGWADGRAVSIGSDGIGLGPNRFGSQLTPLHSPTIINTAFTGLTLQTDVNSFEAGGFFWDLRARTLEQQALEPIRSPVEMLGFGIQQDRIMEEVILRLQAIPEYVDLFEAAFDDPDPISETNIAKALATFERKIITPNTRFDRFLSGNSSAFSQQEIIGLNKFIDGGCARCHSGPMLSDNLLHENDIVVGDRAVRTPTMRNLVMTSPFMHNGSVNSLSDAIGIYEDRGDLLVTLDEDDIGDIQAFLRTLSSNDVYSEIPDSVPSGLPVGGDIQ